MSQEIHIFNSPQRQQEFEEAYRGVLIQWTAPYEEMFIATRYGQTHVIASGPADAPALVLLHAFFATAAVWFPNVGELSQRYRVYAVDVLGEANLSRPERVIKSLDEMTEWFSDLLNGLGVARAFVAGNSFGGFLSATFAMKIPERVRGVIMIGPAATIQSIPPFYRRMFIPKMLLTLFPWFSGARKLVENGVEWMRAGLELNPAWKALFLKAMLYGGTAMQLFPLVYSAEQLGGIQAPALLLIGDREKIYPPQAAVNAARAAMPNLRAEIIPNAHHITALAQPALVNRAILKFLDELE